MSTTVQELTVAWEGLLLAGDLHLPDRDPPHPAVVLLQGSGPADRTSDGYFVPIRDVFLGAGLGVFSFDKPGCGASTGDWRDHGLHARASQAAAALEAISAQPGIDSARVGVFGHSQGGWLVQMLASERPDIAFAISSSGPSITLVEQNRYETEHAMRADGWTEDQIADALVFVERVRQAAVAGLGYDDLTDGLLSEVRSRPWYGPYVTIDDERDWRLHTTFVTEQHDPLAALGQVGCPYLAVFGEDDVLVPAGRGAEETSEALAAAPTADATVVVYPRANHRLQERSEGPFVAGYLDGLADWVRQRTR